MTQTWGLLPRPTRPALYSQADVYPSRCRFVWFRIIVSDHCAAKQVFSIPPFGVHREKGQQASGTPPLVILYERGANRFLGSDYATARFRSSTSSTSASPSRRRPIGSSRPWRPALRPIGLRGCASPDVLKSAKVWMRLPGVYHPITFRTSSYSLC